jgi:ubiquinone/menaquinone biosynthesis C-methylase UbiE
MAFDRYDYGSVAAIYDELAAFYSLGRIAATKRVHLEVVKPGDRVLYAGIGRGQEALEAARRGASVTGVDLSSVMLDRVRRAFEREGMAAELVEADVASLPRTPDYDVVVAHYFLNLFDANRTRGMLEILSGRVRPGGFLVLADFARPAGGRWARIVTALYYRPINWIAWALGLCDQHDIADYRQLLDRERFRIVSERRIPLLAGQNPAYVAFVARKPHSAALAPLAAAEPLD